MSALQDPSKKATINSLLNPPQASAYSNNINDHSSAPLPVNHSQSHVNPNVYGPNYGPNSNYNLRAASWELAENPATRKIVNGPQVQQQQYLYAQQPHSGVSAHITSNGYTYPSSPPRDIRTSSADSHVYATGEQGWQPVQQHQQSGSSMSYSLVQEDQRSTLSRDYPGQNTYPSYTNQTESSVYQSADRASVRIAAKALAYSSHPQQDYPYSEPPPYYGQQNIYGPPIPSYPQPSPPEASAGTSAPQQAQIIRPSGSSSTAASKRSLPENEATPAPSSKRPKSKGKSTSSETSMATTTTPGTSKRGYNAKKRSEAAIISAQNDALQRAQQAGTDIYQHQSGNIPYPATTTSDGLSYIPELQFARCMSNRYKKEEFPRCVSCTRRWAGDTCRFQGIRYFMRDAQRKLCGVSFNERTTPIASIMDFPTKWNRNFEKEHATRSKLSIAKALLPTLIAEQQHIKVNEIVRRPRESDVRATCDTCMTSLFSASFMCRMCGREVCNECYQQVRELTEQPIQATSSELSALSVRRDKYAHSNPFFLACTKRNEHGVSEFTPVTRFISSELDTTVKEMREILQKETSGKVAQDHGPLNRGRTSEEQPTVSQQNPPPITQYSLAVDDFPDPLTSPVYDDYTPSNALLHTTSIPVHRVQIIPAALYDPPSTQSTPTKPAHVFSNLWQLGLPVLVKDVLPRFKLTWTPQYFMDRYGDQGCLVVECQTDTVKRVSIREFFGWFGQYGGRTECWKLKDWPPTADFKSAFPELYKDFSEAVPVPDYVRRDGVYNIGSHFPSNAVGPDLGPKMYNSMASSQEAGSKGSTRLHMDMADALNVMLHAEPCEDGTEGYAVWDLFRAEDSDLIRKFLKKRFAFNAQQASSGGSGQAGPSGQSGSNAANSKVTGDKVAAPIQMIGHDPIHGQQFYLDVELRRLLFEETGVKSFRIYQRPGDGVFIPAGCAHQVANMSDCMKIAIDFVSPENIDRCEKLTKEFREQNQSKVWKEDVLQLRTMMWFAWQSSCIREELLAKEEESSNNTGNSASTQPITTGTSPPSQ